MSNKTALDFPDDFNLNTVKIENVWKTPKQSVLMSALETAVQGVSGIIVAMLIWHFLLGPIVAPELNSWRDGVAVNFPFVVASYIRGFIIRRIFNSL